MDLWSVEGPQGVEATPAHSLASSSLSASLRSLSSSTESSIMRNSLKEAAQKSCEDDWRDSYGEESFESSASLRSSTSSVPLDFASASSPVDALKREETAIKEVLKHFSIPVSHPKYQETFEELGRLGKGAYGSVHVARHRSEGTLYAIKKVIVPLYVPRSTLNPKSEMEREKWGKLAQKFLREVQIMAALCTHSHLVRYHQSWLELVPTAPSAPTFTSLSTSSPATGDSSDPSCCSSSMPYSADSASFDMSSQINSLPNLHPLPQLPEPSAHTDKTTQIEDAQYSFNSFSSNPRIENPASDPYITLSSTSSGTEEIHLEANQRLQDSEESSEQSIVIRDQQPASFSLVLYIQMELCSGDSLHNWLRQPGREVDPEVNRKFFAQLLTGLSHIHSQGYFHRDIKPDNLLIVHGANGAPALKLGDFGLSKKMDCKRIESLASSSDLIVAPKPILAIEDGHTKGRGTAAYMAPELMRKTYDEKVDIFAAGIVLFEMYNCWSTGSERIHAVSRLKNEGYLEEEFVKRHPEIAKLILLMTHKEAHLRPSALDILNHPILGFAAFKEIDLDIVESTFGE